MEKKEEKENVREKLLDREQNLIRAQESPEFFACETEPTHNVDVHITIPAKGADLEKIFQAERLLTEAGLSFDTGYGGGCRDWEFDWSLRGAFVKKVRDLSEDEQMAYKLKRLLSPGREEVYLPSKVIALSRGEIFVIIFGKKVDFESIVKERLVRNGAEEIRQFKVKEEGAKESKEDWRPVKDEDDFIGFRWQGRSIKISYTENKTGY